MEPILTVDKNYTDDDFSEIRDLKIRYFRLNPGRIGLDRSKELITSIRTIIPHSIIFVDTSGSKCRIKMKNKGTCLKSYTTIGICEPAEIIITPFLFHLLKVNEELQIDGRSDNIQIRITNIGNNMASAIVNKVGIINNNAHIYLKNKYIAYEKLNEIDISILEKFPDIDVIGLSFTDSLDLIKQAQNYSEAKFYAKIESPVGVANAKSIIQTADGIIIARDDLSRFYDKNMLDEVMKYLIDKCYQINKPYIPASNLFLDLINIGTMTKEAITRLEYLKSRNTKFIYCNESVIKKDISIIKEICQLCRD